MEGELTHIQGFLQLSDVLPLEQKCFIPIDPLANLDAMSAYLLISCELSTNLIKNGV